MERGVCGGAVEEGFVSGVGVVECAAGGVYAEQDGGDELCGVEDAEQVVVESSEDLVGGGVGAGEGLELSAEVVVYGGVDGGEGEVAEGDQEVVVRGRPLDGEQEVAGVGMGAEGLSGEVEAWDLRERVHGDSEVGGVLGG